jgi:hypothetical protein
MDKEKFSGLSCLVVIAIAVILFFIIIIRLSAWGFLLKMGLFAIPAAILLFFIPRKKSNDK